MFTLFFILILVLLFAFGIGAFIFNVITQSINRKGELGLNFRPLICPRCGEKAVLLSGAGIKSLYRHGLGRVDGRL